MCLIDTRVSLTFLILEPLSVRATQLTGGWRDILGTKRLHVSSFSSSALLFSRELQLRISVPRSTGAEPRPGTEPVIAAVVAGEGGTTDSIIVRGSIIATTDSRGVLQGIVLKQKPLSSKRGIIPWEERVMQVESGLKTIRHLI